MHDETHIDAPIGHATEAPLAWLAPLQLAPALMAVPTTARFALSGVILPPMEESLTIGDCVRRALLRISDGHPVFAGRDAAGRVLRGACHNHAWFLPADDDTDGFIDHVVVHARAGFDRAGLRALVRLRQLWGHGRGDLGMTLMDLGGADELGCLRRDALHRNLAPQLGTARVWESVTPFVPPWHVKVRGGRLRDVPHEQVARLLALHGFPSARVDPLAADDAMPPRPPAPAGWHRFLRLRRSGGGSRGVNAALGFRLCFERPVTGPIALGYAAHQGLGQFVAVE